MMVYEQVDKMWQKSGVLFVFGLTDFINTV